MTLPPAFTLEIIQMSGPPEESICISLEVCITGFLSYHGCYPRFIPTGLCTLGAKRPWINNLCILNKA